MMKTITLNGQQQTFSNEVNTIDQLLQYLQLTDRILIVEKNKQILNKDEYDQPILDRDQIEIIHFVGGG
ncbi:MAG TPA: sulfur carrier protein ThiS [Sporosarcina sp.]|nr:sulfur carrier protein ThiS [Sporosarcina sp.]